MTMVVCARRDPVTLRMPSTSERGYLPGKSTQQFVPHHDMSQLDLRRFAYQRRKEPLLPVRKNPPCEEEENSGLLEKTDRPAVSSPNKASQDLTSTVPETPDSCWPKAAAPASGNAKKVQLAKRGQRRRNRALSSSDEDGESVGHGGKCPPSNLFEGLGTSKRRKRGPDDACYMTDKENTTADEFSLYDHVTSKTRKRASVNRKDRVGGASTTHHPAELDCLPSHNLPGQTGTGTSGGCGYSEATCRSRSGKYVDDKFISGNWTDVDAIDRLVEMFPKHSPGYLRAVARRHMNVSEAVAVIIADSNMGREQGS